MDDKEAAEMVQRCISEIEGLRRQIERLAPKAAAYDCISQILGLLPQSSMMGAGEDVLWRLRMKLEELKPKNELAGEAAQSA